MLLRQAVCFLLCFMLMGVVAISRSGRLFGIHIPREGESPEQIVEPITAGPDGYVTINTTPLAGNVIGYAGPTPVEIILKDDTIRKIKPLKNRETPEFLGAVLNSYLFESWYGKTLQEAADVHPDAVSGATFTSTAIISNVEAGIAYAQDKPVARADMKLDFKFFCTVFIILMAALLPFFIKWKPYRTFQLILNVVILGFWGGTFISYSLMTSLMANGIRFWLGIPMLLMIATAFFYPFFGKRDHYCNWICPYGSIQELAGKCIKFKIKLTPPTARRLGYVRDALWIVLMWFMMAGIWFDWMDWEPFAAFYFGDAAPVTLGIAGGFLLLSFIIRRPYCRFVCPTGTLFKLSEGSN